VRVKNVNSPPLVPLFNIGLTLKILKESICAHKDSFLIPNIKVTKAMAHFMAFPTTVGKQKEVRVPIVKPSFSALIFKGLPLI